MFMPINLKMVKVRSYLDFHRFLFFMKTGMVAACAILFARCSPEGISPDNDPYVFQQPRNFPDALYTFQNNEVSREGFELGRALFYDPVLSSDSSIACATCHQQAKAFSDPVHALSVGVNDRVGIRNAPAVQNMAFQNHFFWDGGVKHLDFVPINAITNEKEMAEKVAQVVLKLNRSNLYPEKFVKAFGEGEPTSQKMLFALSQFMNLMVSSNSRYDKYVRKEGEALTTDELEGLVLFNANCRSCHATDLFSDGSFRNNGLDTSFEKDEGRAHITELKVDLGKFKVPSLRNAELTAPYMHDGRFRTLQEVLNHYAETVKLSETLDDELKRGSSLGIALTEEEKVKIIAFIKTLSDKTFTQDKRFSNPFLK
jgi:cytochrome c peroxidase